jgi:DNA polymerase III subunit gamma/tau
MSDTPEGPMMFDEPGLPGFPTAAPQATALQSPAPQSPAIIRPAADAAPAYRVLARKYRPQSFADLIGQDPMVQTISNGFANNRIPQAWIMTGVRGVGKTTTARIIARGLNFVRADGSGGPTVDLSEKGVHCDAIIEGRHIDVMEIDAASNNGVDNVRQINDSVNYSPASARYKIYIIDEVHMLSTGAFNAFLKTLEEPPPHAKFVFATTEIRKVPVTILSRCQRFDLRRVESGVLVNHLKGICAAENVAVEDEALASIARAGEGSVRDALSILDQAIAHGAGAVTEENVRAMLGLADRAQVIDIFDAIMRGDLPTTFALLREQYNSGADPAVVLTDLASFTHLVTRIKIVPEAAKDPSLTQTERKRGAEMAGSLSMRVLSRAWQILLKSISEVQSAPRPLAAAEMVLARLAYAADLPTPDDALKMLRDKGAGSDGNSSHAPAPSSASAASSSGSSGGFQSAEPRSAGAAAVSVNFAGTGASAATASAQRIEQLRMQAAPQTMPSASPALTLARFDDFVALASENREIALKAALERDVRLVRFEDGVIEFALTPGASHTLAADIGRALQAWTGRRWMVAVSSQPGAPTLRELANAREDERRNDAQMHPLVQGVLKRFPKATIVDIRSRGETQASAELDPQLADTQSDEDSFVPYTDNDF